MTWEQISHFAAYAGVYIICALVLATIVGIAMAECGAPQYEDDYDMHLIPPQEPAHGATDGESDLERHQRQEYVKRRDRVLAASRREIAEARAAKNGARK